MHGSPRLPASVIGGGLLGLYALVVMPSVGQSLVETYPFRQTQTAYTAFLYAEQGIDLLRPPLPILGPPGVIPFEFPLLQAIGAVVIRAGTHPDTAMRLVGLASFLASAWLVFLVARRFLSTRGALVALIAFLFNPHALLYGRTSLIEYLATAFGLVFVLFIMRFGDSGRPMDWLVALVGASGVLLVKITTAPVLLLPALFWRARGGKPAIARASTWVLLAIAGTFGLAWHVYADTVRSGNPATEFLAAASLRDWFVGSLEQRMDLSSWRTPLAVMLALTGSAFVVWGYLAIRFARGHAQRAFILATVGLVAMTPVVLFNMYATHDYYYSALAPLVALGIGSGAEYVLARSPTRSRNLFAAGLTAAWLATLVGGAPTWTRMYGAPPDQDQVFETVEFIRDNSERDDWIVLEGFGWDPTFFYYARRQGFANPVGNNLLESGDINVDAIVSDPIYGPFFLCDDTGACTVNDTRPTGP